MKKLFQKEYKYLILFLIFILVFFSGYLFFISKEKIKKNVILIGWDGAQRDHLYKMIERNKLPNLGKIIKEGSIVNINITTGETETKPGWAEILTGYGSEITGVYSNMKYKPIPKGYTIFERLEEYFGKENIVTVFIGGKVNNIGGRGPHKICLNCLHRDRKTFKKTNWWDENVMAPLKDGQTKRLLGEREGEPYYQTQDSIDLYLTALGKASNVGQKSLDLLEEYKDKKFFMFFQFEEPDEPGHLYGENSPEYDQGLITNDDWLGQIISKLKELDIYSKTVIYIVSDHGFNEGEMSHNNAPYVFLATNNSKDLRNGDRKDITPTLLDNFGINIDKINPPIRGKSLFEN